MLRNIIEGSENDHTFSTERLDSAWQGGRVRTSEFAKSRGLTYDEGNKIYNAVREVLINEAFSNPVTLEKDKKEYTFNKIDKGLEIIAKT